MRDIYERAYRVIRANVSMYHQNHDWYTRQNELFPITGSHLKHAREIYQSNKTAYECAMRSFRESHVISDEQPIVDLIVSVLNI